MKGSVTNNMLVWSTFGLQIKLVDGGGGGGPCRISIIRNSNVALSIFLKTHVVLSN